MKNYIIGYGSLMESESRKRTTPHITDVFPVIVKGIRRGWFARTNPPGLSTTFLGCIKEPDYSINAVIYEATLKEIEETDKRETGYQRIEVDRLDIKLLASEIDKRAKFWIYLNIFQNQQELLNCIPDNNCPIVQSYVDICMNGCIEIEEKFEKAKEINFVKTFIQSTTFWNEYWANDRIYPRRPFIHQKNAYKIDAYLKEYLKDPSLFDNIYIE